ncbi:hypothetical protein EVAR_59174_1 [Eumeta japonica]|uniref:Uncharacterized protein n=1 Tax=Eumeta variegata TaxID=151549 RepID=A0A4C1YWA1_EUMVA|nr:hypothetical protein EVAR_59174_1 [Eumeta japonica]
MDGPKWLRFIGDTYVVYVLHTLHTRGRGHAIASQSRGRLRGGCCGRRFGTELCVAHVRASSREAALSSRVAKLAIEDSALVTVKRRFTSVAGLDSMPFLSPSFCFKTVSVLETHLPSSEPPCEVLNAVCLPIDVECDFVSTSPTDCGTNLKCCIL